MGAALFGYSTCVVSRYASAWYSGGGAATAEAKVHNF
jgi:hypothetical protein